MQWPVVWAVLSGGLLAGFAVVSAMLLAIKALVQPPADVLPDLDWDRFDGESLPPWPSPGWDS